MELPIGHGLVVPKEPCSSPGGNPDSPQEGHFGGYTWTYSYLPAVDMLNLIREEAAAMRPLATGLL